MNNIKNGLLEAEKLMCCRGFKLIESFGMVEPGDPVKKKKNIKRTIF